MVLQGIETGSIWGFLTSGAGGRADSPSREAYRFVGGFKNTVLCRFRLAWDWARGDMCSVVRPRFVWRWDGDMTFVSVKNGSYWAEFEAGTLSYLEWF